MSRWQCMQCSGFVHAAGRLAVAVWRKMAVWRWVFPAIGRHWIGLTLAALAVLLVLWAWDGVWSRLPWSAERRLDRAEADLAETRSSLRAREIEAEARSRQARAVTAAHAVLSETRAATARAVTQSEGAPDADQPLDPDRLARLRAHDRRLCDLSPALCEPADGRSAEPVG